MARSKAEVIVKVLDFINDFKALNSSPAEVLSALKGEGLSEGTFWNWKSRADEKGYAVVSESTFTRLCEVSGLSYADYYIGERVRKTTTHPKSNKVHSSRLKNGVRVTVYTKPDMPKSETPSEPVKDELAIRLSSFRNHMEVYRKLLGISTSTITGDYNIENYNDIVNGKEVLSISKYIKISKIFMDTFNNFPTSPLKDAFIELATMYNDIYIGIIYFGDTVGRKKKGR